MADAGIAPGGLSLPAGISESRIRELLETVLQSKAFLSSRRCSGFLRFVVEQALAQNESGLKESAIAESFFGRTSIAEGIEDSVVRVCAREVRKRLERYYAEAGSADSIRIVLPLGSYAPRFQTVQAAPSLEAVASPLPALPLRQSWGRPRRRLWAALCLAVLIVSGALTLRYQLAPGHRFRRFWAPVTNHPRPALVCIGPTLVYGFSRRMHESFLRQNPSALESGTELFQFPREGSIPAEDLVPFTDDRFTSGALDAAIHIAQMFERLGKAAQFRLGGTISAEEAREQPIVLVGAFSNPWTLDWSRNLRYYFHRELAGNGVLVSIRDHKDPRNVWSIPYLERQDMTVDYAIVSRVVDPITRNPVIAIAGLTHYGTQAAAAFVTDAALLDRALRNAPSGWSGRNFEAVLKTAVINRTPNRTKVVTQALW